MQLGVRDAAAMYATACCAWYGAKALKVAHESIRRYKRRGDGGGVAMWTEIAAVVSALQAKNRRRAEARGKLY
jgi:hypothetical protein